MKTDFAAIVTGMIISVYTGFDGYVFVFTCFYAFLGGGLAYLGKELFELLFIYIKSKCYVKYNRKK
jgi:hypothetical protein